LSESNTIFASRYVRRSLPGLATTFEVPKNKKIEVISFLKPNGDSCMFSYLPSEGLYLIASRNLALLVKDAEDLAKTDIRNQWLKQIGVKFFKNLNKQAAEVILAHQTVVGEYLSRDNLILYSDEQILMHSIVDNATGSITCDAANQI
jgi:hypothetical protein